MTNEKVTPWIDGSVKPVRNGVYQRKYSGYLSGNTYSLFKNGVWYCWSNNAFDASRSVTESMFQDDICWRGLAKNPKVKP